MEFEKEFLELLKKKQIYVSDSRKFADDKSKRLIGVEVELTLPKEVELSFPAFSVDFVSKRGVVTSVTDFELVPGDDSKLLKFICSMRVPDNVDLAQFKANTTLATSFMDLCWFSGIEDIADDYKPTADTEPKAGSVSCDLGYYLPARFLDRLVSSLGDFNAIFLNGALDNAMVYGTLVKED